MGIDECVKNEIEYAKEREKEIIHLVNNWLSNFNIIWFYNKYWGYKSYEVGFTESHLI